MPRSSPSTVSIFRSSFFFLLHVGEKTECQLRNLVSTQFLSRRAVNETRAVSFRWAVSFSQGRVESNSTVSAISAMPSNSRWTTVEFHQCQTAYGFSWRLARLVMCILFTVRTWISLQVFRHLPNNWIERFVSFFFTATTEEKSSLYNSCHHSSYSLTSSLWRLIKTKNSDSLPLLYSPVDSSRCKSRCEKPPRCIQRVPSCFSYLPEKKYIL